MVFTLLLIALRANSDGPAPELLAADGKSRVTVVLPQGAGEIVKLAGADLARCLGKSLSVEVPVVSQLAAVRTPLSILLGEAFGVDFAASADDLTRDGCILKTRGSSLLIAGASDYGTANGVYTFLSEQIGVRWFAPGELYEIIPENANLVLPELDTKKNPDFAYRLFSGIVGDKRAWERRNRMDIDAVGLPGYGFGHNLYRVFPPSVYGKEHPEYYALVDGKRQVPDQDDAQTTQPCFTNPDVIRIAAEKAAEFFRKNPRLTTFSLCTNDGSVYCRCPNCAALDEPMRKSKSGWDIHSDSYFHFVTEVARIVGKTNPGKFLGCYAYWCTELPPRKIEKLPDNVAIGLTQDTSQHFDIDYRTADRGLFADWSRAAKRVGKYDYYGLGWITPRFYPRLAADDIKFLRAGSAAGFYCEVYPNWAVTAPQLYLATQLLWDAALDPDVVLDDYYKTLYGPAAGEIRKFYSILEQYWQRPRKGKWFQGLNNVAEEIALADADRIEQAWQCLFRAKPMVIGKEVQRIVDLEDHFKVPYFFVNGCAQAEKIVRWKITGRDDLAKLIGESLKTLEYVRLAESSYEGLWRKNALYQHVYYQPARFEEKMNVWRESIRASVQSALDKVGAYCRAELPPDERDIVWADLRDRLLADATARKLGIVDAAGHGD